MPWTDFVDTLGQHAASLGALQHQPLPVQHGELVLLSPDTSRLVPIEQVPKPKQLGLLRGRIEVPCDFNAPLTASVLADLQGH